MHTLLITCTRTLLYMQACHKICTHITLVSVSFACFPYSTPFPCPPPCSNINHLTNSRLLFFRTQVESLPVLSLSELCRCGHGKERSRLGWYVLQQSCRTITSLVLLIFGVSMCADGHSERHLPSLLFVSACTGCAVCMFVSVHVVCVHVVYVCTYTCLCLYICVCMCMCVCVHVCMFVCVYVCIPVCAV